MPDFAQISAHLAQFRPQLPSLAQTIGASQHLTEAQPVMWRTYRPVSRLSTMNGPARRCWSGSTVTRRGCWDPHRGTTKTRTAVALPACLRVNLVYFQGNTLAPLNHRLSSPNMNCRL